MRTQLTLLVSLSFLNAFSHQDTFYKFKYENVSVILQTGFHNEQVNNAKIIGQYAAMLCEKVNYPGDIFLFFGHDYIPDSLSFHQTFMSFRNESTYKILGLKSYNTEDSLNHILLNDNEKIIIQQFGESFDIKYTLELLNFGIHNTELLIHGTEDYYALGYDIVSIDKSVIESIKDEDTKIVNDALENTVHIYPKTEKRSKFEFNHDLSYYSENGKYILIHNMKSIIDTLNQISVLSSIHSWTGDYIVVLTKDKSITIYSDGFNSNDFIKSDIFKPMSINYNRGISEIKLSILKPEILLIEFLDWSGMSTDMKYIYLRNKDILITDFMEYLNSY